MNDPVDPRLEILLRMMKGTDEWPMRFGCIKLFCT